MKLLITGFDPFGGEITNPAYEAVKTLPSRIAGITLVKLEIPTVFEQSAKIVNEAIIEHQVDLVLNVGQAGGRAGLTFERVAINLDDARISDNLGQQPLNHTIQENGPAAYFSQLPLKGMVAGVKEIGLPASISYSAGTFVCNHIMYQVHHLIATTYPKIRGGFIHVPYSHQQVLEKPGVPSMSITDIAKGLEAAIKQIGIFAEGEDLQVIAGTEH